jgi:hypothetical protein
MDPGGPTVVEVTLFVEQRYKAHLVQSSWPQPSAATVQLRSKQTAQCSLSSLAESIACNPCSLAILSILIRGSERKLDGA